VVCTTAGQSELLYRPFRERHSRPPSLFHYLLTQPASPHPPIYTQVSSAPTQSLYYLKKATKSPLSTISTIHLKKPSRESKNWPKTRPTTSPSSTVTSASKTNSTRHSPPPSLTLSSILQDASMSTKVWKIL